MRRDELHLLVVGHGVPRMARLQQVAILLQNPLVFGETRITEIVSARRPFQNHAIDDTPHVVQHRHRIRNRADVRITGQLVDQIAPTHLP